MDLMHVFWEKYAQDAQRGKNASDPSRIRSPVSRSQFSTGVGTFHRQGVVVAAAAVVVVVVVVSSSSAPPPPAVTV
ncbi:hypothetical protein ElyMa_001099300 [Elysia marginata]|uniref:Uncharacterized protein n=1 Tax=Elysia marginata TaxID=1093978 RepID=A0AAV4HV35_9GAST|nr:hypothetical protein ElyMa_001099300 [Elysia marginata]